MAEISKITLPNNLTYDLKVFSNHVYPYLTKRYESTSYYATAANQLQSTWYFMSIRPDSWTKPWRVKFKLHTWCPGHTEVESYTYSTFTGTQTSIRYANWNELYNTAHYYISYFELNQTGYNAGYGHAIGMSILYGSSYTTAAYYRSFEIELFEVENCTVTLLDTPVKWDSWPGTGATNYNRTSPVNTNGASAGLQLTGDSNDSNYVNRIYYGRWKPYTNLYRYQILFQKNDVYLLPTNITNNSTATTKTLTTLSFDPFGYVFFYNSTSTYAANYANVADGVLYNQYNAVDLRYGFNIGTTLTSGENIYIVADMQSDGSAKLASNPIAKTLPSTEDGHIYIFFGKAINTYQVDMYPYHPIFWYKGGKVRYFTKADANNNGALWVYNSTNDSVELIFPN